ncbi:thioredoxin [Agromyces badenianii]|uniref:Thioredoxin n=1 Tax=Agromyces badenianii TaxID=2080742 RepID=A0A2S0WV24_9MICO|nr:thioredoxin family protein [Agromyces badenianii]AWB95196.1 thioredoxin [Agromyces badenianii]
MDWITALATGAALLLGATAIGLLWRARQGVARRGSGDLVRPDELGVAAFGERATLVQFSTEFCARCPATGRLLTRLAHEHDGATHVEVDLTHRPDLAGRFHVTETPTTLVLDGEGAIRARIAGLPRAAAVRQRLDDLLRSSSVI